MAKQTKRTKKFSKNHLDRTIKDRKSRQKKTSQIARGGHGKKAQALKKNAAVRKNGTSVAEERDDVEDASHADSEMDEDEDDAPAPQAKGSKGKGSHMTVDDFLGGGFAEGMKDGNDGVDGSDDEDEDEIEDDNDSLQDVDDLSDEEDTHAQDLAKLAEKDPEFFEYLQENDRELLDFGQGDADSNEDMPNTKGKGSSTSSKGRQVVTRDLLRSWQKHILQTHSLKAFRRLLLAFRAAAHMGADDDAELAYVVNDAAVFNKLIMTALKYVPVVLQHHVPAKQQGSGKYKLPTNSKKYSRLQKPIQSFFGSLNRLLRTLPEPKLLYTCVNESTRMIPWLLQNRRMAREYVKILLDLWATSEERVRVVAFLGIRQMTTAGDESVVEICLRGVYRGLVRGCKTTTVHTIDNINLMKNSASELYMIDLNASYQQAFGFIRQLAIHLRACLKNKTPESFQAVYNWQYVHCVDFWAMVLATACDKDRLDNGGATTMQPLIYPIVQAATGAVRLLPTSRYFPLRFHITQSLLRLMQRTGVYIPLAPVLLEILDAPEFTRKTKPSTLKPLNMQVLIRVPKPYLRTKVYADHLIEETSHYLLEFLACSSHSIAFPELVVPIISGLRRAIKVMKAASSRGTARSVQSVKTLIEKINRHSDFVANQRRPAVVDFAPRDQEKVKSFMSNVRSETPMESAARLSRKVRADKQALLQQSHVQVDQEGDSDEDDDLRNELDVEGEE